MKSSNGVAIITVFGFFIIAALILGLLVNHVEVSVVVGATAGAAVAMLDGDRAAATLLSYLALPAALLAFSVMTLLYIKGPGLDTLAVLGIALSIVLGVGAVVKYYKHVS